MGIVGDLKESSRVRSGRLGGCRKTGDEGEVKDKMEGEAWAGGSVGVRVSDNI
jgi:hypothetical protein